MSEQGIPVNDKIGWTSPNGDIAIEVWNTGGDVYQVREIHFGSPLSTIHPYPTEAEARIMARAAAQIIRYNQTGK